VHRDAERSHFSDHRFLIFGQATARGFKFDERNKRAAIMCRRHTVQSGHPFRIVGRLSMRLCTYPSALRLQNAMTLSCNADSSLISLSALISHSVRNALRCCPIPSRPAFVFRHRIQNVLRHYHCSSFVQPLGCIYIATAVRTDRATAGRRAARYG
jgi:hypothetical protein